MGKVADMVVRENGYGCGVEREVVMAGNGIWRHEYDGEGTVMDGFKNDLEGLCMA